MKNLCCVKNFVIGERLTNRCSWGVEKSVFCKKKGYKHQERHEVAKLFQTDCRESGGERRNRTTFSFGVNNGDSNCEQTQLPKYCEAKAEEYRHILQYSCS